MRSDLNKLLCEHERYGSKRGYKEVRRDRTFDLYDEDGPIGRREGMRWRYKFHWNEKEFGENLNPLYGIVHKNVGRKWDDVYSELCKVFDTRSVINQHILFHLDQMLEIKDVFVGEDGDLWIRNNYSGNRPLKDSGSEYYVDPRDGILYRNQAYRTWNQDARKRAAEQRAKRRETYRNEGSFCFIKDEKTGIWYRYDYKEIPASKIVGKWKTSTVGNIVLKPMWVEEVIPSYEFDYYKQEAIKWHKESWRVRVHPDAPVNTVHVNKRTASKKDIKKFQLA